MGGVLYNLLADFRETVLPRSWFEKRLRAVRDFVFLVGADLISQGHLVRIRFAMPQPDRPEFLRRLRTVSDGLPIAAQLEWSLTDQTPSHPDKIITPSHFSYRPKFLSPDFSTAESGSKAPLRSSRGSRRWTRVFLQPAWQNTSYWLSNDPNGIIRAFLFSRSTAFPNASLFFA